MKAVITFLILFVITSLSLHSQCESSFNILETSSGAYLFESTAGTPNTLAGCFWSFGDGNTYDGCFAQYSYAQEGVYAPCLTITTLDGCTATSCDTLAVGATNPMLCGPAGIYVEPLNNSDSFQFGVQANTLFTYYWDFGDNSSSTEGAPTHTFQEGTHQVCLTYTCDNGETGTECVEVTVPGTQGNDCIAEFTYSEEMTASGESVVVLHAAADPAISAQYYWILPNGDVVVNQTYTLVLDPGTYDICLTIDTGDCEDTYCQGIVVGGNNTPDCNAGFTAEQTVTGVVLNHVNQFAGISYWEWSLGNGLASTEVSPSLTSPGSYTVCLLTFCDQNTEDYQCQDIVVGNSNNDCEVNISYTNNPGSLSDYVFVADAQGTGPFTYLWTNANGNVLMGGQTITIALDSGMNLVCVDVTDANGCVASSCEQLEIENPNSAAICGVITTGSANIDPQLDATVYLITYDEPTGLLSMVSEMQIDANPNAAGITFCFEDLTVGQPYMIKVALNEDSFMYSDYLPTYYPHAAFWAEGQEIIATGATTIEIELVAGSNPGGPGFVEGYVYEGAGKTAEVGVPNALVLLLDAEGNAERYTITDEDGYYSFTEVSLGTHQLTIDALNKESERLEFNLEDYEGHSIVINFEEFEDMVEAETVNPTSVIEELLEHDIIAYPNPTDNDFTVCFLGNGCSQVAITASSQYGKRVYSRKVNVTRGVNTWRINSSEWPAGTYTLSIMYSNGESYSTMILKL